MGDWFRELGQFLWAVINNWAGYTTGGVIVAALWLWSTLRQRPLSKKFAMGLTLFFLLMAFFNAWNDQHHTVIDKQRQLDQLSVPQLSSRFMSIVHETGADVVVILDGQIWNQGAPTAILAWEVRTRLEDGSFIYGEVPLNPGDVIIERNNPSGNFTFPANKFWIRNDATIAHGGKSLGWIIARFKNMTHQELIAKKAHILFSYTDVNQKVWTTDEPITKENEFEPPVIVGDQPK